MLQAKEDETIIVYEGIYHENVVIDKPLVLKASGNVTIDALDNYKIVVMNDFRIGLDYRNSVQNNVTFRIRCRESKFIKT